MSKSISKNIFKFFIPIVVVMILVVPMLAQAQGGSGQPNPGGSGGSANSGGSPSGPIIIANPFKQDTIRGLIKTIVNDILIPIGGVVAVLMIIYAGFLFVTARGNETQISKAKQALLYAVIGSAILLGAWVISTAIETTINQLKSS